MVTVPERPFFDDVLARLKRFTNRPVLVQPQTAETGPSLCSNSNLALPFSMARSSSSGAEVVVVVDDDDDDGDESGTRRPSRVATKSFAYRSSPPATESSSLTSNVSSNSVDSSSLSKAYTISVQSIKAAINAFFATQSRVVRLYNLPPSAETVLSAVFLPQTGNDVSARKHVTRPASLWTVREEYASTRQPIIWAVFPTHEEACTALSVSGLPFAVATALETDLEPFHKLKRIILRDPTLTSFLPSCPSSDRPPTSLLPRPMLRVSASHPNLLRHSPAIVVEEAFGASTEYYTLSTNPPNPKTTFRVGDWICPSPTCAAHNFGRNLSCIGCGCPKSTAVPSQQPSQGQKPSQQQQQQQQQQPQQLYSTPTTTMPRTASSPRFSNPANRNSPLRSVSSATPQMNQPGTSSNVGGGGFSQLQASPRSIGYQSQVTGPSKTTHPLLTPSGRAFATGGRVQNVSSDPSNPCIMYWPDNEPFPDPGQIRPASLANVPQPPILNTGNKGPISHQPGDWICKKCNYLNWRRRKVCQTCLPYAEGNGDSISAAVQAERIALLTSVLSQTQLSSNTLGSDSIQPSYQPPPAAAAAAAVHTNPLAPFVGQRPYLDIPVPQLPSLPQAQGQNRLAPADPLRSVHRSQSHSQLGSQYAATAAAAASANLQAPPMSPLEYSASSPIYQTSGHRRPSPLYSTGPNRPPDAQRQEQPQQQQSRLQESDHTPSPSPRSSPRYGTHQLNIATPAPLLPSFLQDIVQSPALSPTSTTTSTTASSSDVPYEDEYEEVMNSRHTFPRGRGASESHSVGDSSDGGSSTSSVMNNMSIWRLDGEESKNMLGFHMLNQQDAIGVAPGPGVIGEGRKKGQNIGL